MLLKDHKCVEPSKVGLDIAVSQLSLQPVYMDPYPLDLLEFSRIYIQSGLQMLDCKRSACLWCWACWMPWAEVMICARRSCCCYPAGRCRSCGLPGSCSPPNPCLWTCLVTGNFQYLWQSRADPKGVNNRSLVCSMYGGNFQFAEIRSATVQNTLSSRQTVYRKYHKHSVELKIIFPGWNPQSLPPYPSHVPHLQFWFEKRIF